MSRRLANDPQMTVERCLSACAREGYAYAGPQYFQECFCDDHLPAQDKRKPDSECNAPCKGRKSENCGGTWRLGAYRAKPSHLLWP